MRKEVALYVDEALGKYGFPDGHPWGTDRQNAFWKEATKQKLDQAADLTGSRTATAEEIARFHGEDHVQRVHQLSDQGYGSIDYGDTPAFPGVYEATAHVVGAALDGLARVMAGDVLRTFQPIGGLHHASRDNAAGFCVFNDCGVVIDTLRSQYGIKRVAYVDIDVHHGDGVQAIFWDDPDVLTISLHQDRNYPLDTGGIEARGGGTARDALLARHWDRAGDAARAAAWAAARAAQECHLHKMIGGDA